MFLSSIEEIRQAVAVPASPGLPDFIHDVLLESHAVLQGHFALQSGAHAERFLRFRNIGRDRQLVDEVARKLRSTLDFDVSGTIVLTPESAGFFLGEAFARVHKPDKLDLAVAQIDSRRAPIQQLRHGKIPKGARIVIVNDVATTGRSLTTLRDLAHASGAIVAGVLVFSTLDGTALNAQLADWRVPGRFLVEARWPTFRPGECPRCRDSKLPPFPAAELN